MIIDSTEFLRKYFLASEDGGIAWEKDYSLVFTTNGQMFVRSMKSYDQPFKSPVISEIFPSDFSATTVNGISLDQLVAKKLEEILPEPHIRTK